MATTPTRTPKSAVRVLTELPLVPRLSFVVADFSCFHVAFFPLREVPVSSYQSFPLPKRSRVSASVEEV